MPSEKRVKKRAEKIPSDRFRKAGALLAEDHHGDEDDHAAGGAERSGC